VLEARFVILKSCLLELCRVGLVHGEEQEKKFLLECSSSSSSFNNNNNNNTTAYYWLTKAAEVSQGLSGRALRKIPIQAFTFHLHNISNSNNNHSIGNFDYVNTTTTTANHSEMLDNSTGSSTSATYRQQQYQQFEMVDVAQAFYLAIVEENKNRNKLNCWANNNNEKIVE
jgi:hypothetical protein